MEPRQQGRDPRVGAGADVDVGGIIRLEIRQRRIHARIVGLPRGRQRLQHQVADAVAHHAAVFVHGVQRKAARLQRVVDRCAEVFQRVQQGAVQVEEDEFFHAG